MGTHDKLYDSVELAAIRQALDRVGLKPPTEVAVGPARPHESISDEISTVSRAESRRQGGLEADQLDEAECIKRPSPSRVV